MKCLSLKQPFAELLVSGKKTIELRNWNTHFRGTFLIHASKKPMEEACVAFGFNPKSMVKGAIIGSAFLYGVKEYHTQEEYLEDQKRHLGGGDFANDRYGFMIKNASKFKKPIPLAGKLNFFEVEMR
ncbi:MAG: ASCH domain-containing protein [Candidatus Micrarchaeales archaeon]